MPDKLDERQIRKIDGRLMKQANRANVLNLVRADPTLSRSSIARITGLSSGSVTTIVDHLLREGLVREEGATITGTAGRRPLRLAFVPGARLALGIAIDVPEVRAALVDLGGTARSTYRAVVPAGATSARVLDIAAQLAQRALRDAPGDQVLGVGMAVPGIVSWPDGVNRFSPNFGWRDVPIRALMEQRLGQPVLVDNEVRALALAEHEFGAAKRARSAVFLDLGYGLGGAVIIDGSLYRGAHGGAGEIGHNTVEPSGPLCSCGNRGCLEVFASESGLLARAREALAAGSPSSLAGATVGSFTLDALLEAARRDDPLAGELIRQAARYLGLVVANAIDNWDPEIVVLSGPVMDAGGALFDELLRTEQRTVLETARHRVQVVRAQLDRNAKIVGAAYSVIADYLAAPLQNRDGLVL